jgi:hypothetical protein
MAARIKSLAQCNKLRAQDHVTRVDAAADLTTSQRLHSGMRALLVSLAPRLFRQHPFTVSNTTE